MTQFHTSIEGTTLPVTLQAKPVPAGHTQRDDVQGISGLAIASVLLFHFFLEFFPNGYLGVDVFFVISGFLIVRILGRAIEKNDGISASIIGNFYFRRLRRIVPLYYLYCLIASLLFSVLSNSLQVEAAQRSALAAVSFYTNIRAHLHQFDYFEQVLSEDLFTHTWSLSMEIQFYLLAPILFVIRAMIKSCWSSWALFATVSLFSVLVHALSDAQMCFHFVLARFWQFLAVAVLEMNDSSSTVADSDGIIVDRPRNAICLPVVLAALVPLCVGFVPFFELNPLHGRLSVTLAAGLLIAMGESQMTSSSVYRLLSWSPLVWLGDVSYSLYLVHWPLSVYIVQNNEVFSPIRCSVLLLCASLSAIAFAPYFNDITHTVPITLADAIKENRRAFAESSNDLIIPECNYIHWKDYPWETLKKGHFGKPLGYCDMPPGTGKLRFLVVGNSYAPNHADLVYRQFRPFFKNFTLFSKSACEPLYITHPYAYCTKFVNFTDVIDYVKPDITFVILRYGKAKEEPTPPGQVDKPLEVMKYHLDEIEKRTASLVFLMDSFAIVRSGTITHINELIMKNVSADEINSKAIVLEEDANARPRTQKLTCKKCILYDIEPALSDANFKLRAYDGATHLAFFEPGGHLSPWGRRKVESVYSALAEKYADQLRAIVPRRD